MKKSIKRIIWALGWYACWLVTDYLIILKGEDTGKTGYVIGMLAIWLIPLFLFKDDKK